MKGSDLERAVTAILQASGWFIIRGATDETFQAFELDTLGYRFDDGSHASLVIESKGGKSGFGDLWKLVGLKTHLGIARGVLLADQKDIHHAEKVRLGAGHEIAVIDRDPSGLAKEMLAARVVADAPSGAVADAWVRCMRVEDGLIRVLLDKQLWKSFETIRLAKRQLQHLSSSAWIEPDPWRQAVNLYALYQEQPKIALRMANEISPGQTQTAMNEALYGGALPEVQACFYLEHRKRIAVAFAATRCAALRDESSESAHEAPTSFRQMVQRIQKEQAWYLPAVLQVYFLGFGGMICSDKEDAEFAAIASQADCTADQARRALELFDELFPTSGGWFYDRYDLVRLKLAPVPLRGAGTWMREAVYGQEWDVMATASQLKVVGKKEIDRAFTVETDVLPRRAKVIRRVKSR